MKKVGIGLLLRQWQGVPILVIINIILHGWSWDAVITSCIGTVVYFLILYLMLRFVVPDEVKIPEERE